MKKMEYTTKTGCNPLSLRDLGGGDFAVTSSFTYRYRAFRRCQTRASAKGSLRLLYPLPQNEITKHIINKIKMNIMTEIKKKNYVSPSMEVYEVKSMQLLLNASPEIGGADEGLGDSGCED